MPAFTRIPTTLPECQRALRSCNAQRVRAWGMYFESERRRVADDMARSNALEQLVGTQEPAASVQNSRLYEQLRVLWNNTKQRCECNICMEMLRPELKDLKHPEYMCMFQCGHHLCHKCAWSLKQSGRTPACPTCRADIGSELARIEAPAAEGGYSTETHAATALGLAASAARTEYAVAMGAEVPEGVSFELARWAGKCKACFEPYEAGAEIAASRKNPRFKVHVGCVDTSFGTCHFCPADLDAAEHVAMKAKDKLRACKDCGVQHKWPGAKALGVKRKRGDEGSASTESPSTPARPAAVPRLV